MSFTGTDQLIEESNRRLARITDLEKECDELIDAMSRLKASQRERFYLAALTGFCANRIIASVDDVTVAKWVGDQAQTALKVFNGESS